MNKLESKLVADRRILANLIKSSEVVEEGAKKYWIKLIPAMDKDDIAKLAKILKEAKTKIEKIKKKK